MKKFYELKVCLMRRTRTILPPPHPICKSDALSAEIIGLAVLPVNTFLSLLTFESQASNGPSYTRVKPVPVPCS